MTSNPRHFLFKRMATTIEILVIPTYDLNTLAIYDNSTYDAPLTATYTIEVPGFGTVTGITFTPSTLNVYNSVDLGISIEEESLPDGMYCISYIANPLLDDAVEKKIMRVSKLQEKFDEAFMKLDIMECDKALKKQAQVDLMTIYFFIQGTIASANNCAVVEATKLYIKADAMLNTFLQDNCGCSGNNYIINFS
jgi:hypothetical protein